MVGEPSHVKQLSLNHVCKIGLSEKIPANDIITITVLVVYMARDLMMRKNLI